MRYKALIFDMDGTIIATEHIWKYARNTVITSRGIQITPELDQELHRRLAGTAMKESCRIIKELTNIPDSVEQLMREKSLLADAAYEKEVCFIPGFLPFHQKLSALSLPMAIATNASDKTVEITNNKLNLKSLFGNHIYMLSHVDFIGKPDPAIYRYAAQQLTVNPTDCIAIEDSANGIKSAKAAGMFCIGINSSGNLAALSQADMIINSYEEVDIISLLKI